MSNGNTNMERLRTLTGICIIAGEGVKSYRNAGNVTTDESQECFEITGSLVRELLQQPDAHEYVVALVHLAAQYQIQLEEK